MTLNALTDSLVDHSCFETCGIHLLIIQSIDKFNAGQIPNETTQCHNKHKLLNSINNKTQSLSFTQSKPQSYSQSVDIFEF